MVSQNVISRRKIEDLIARGQIIVVYEGRALQLDRWIEKHPGGRLPLLHMVGVDATCEINAYHSTKTLRLMKAYSIGQVGHDWRNFTPPIRGGKFRTMEKQETAVGNVSNVDLKQEVQPRADLDHTKPLSDLEPSMEVIETERDIAIAQAMQAEIDACLETYPSVDLITQNAITKKFEALHERIRLEGYYTSHYSNYLRESVRYALLFSLFIYFLQARWYLPSALCLGGFWQQIMFTAHDAGHRSITQNGDFDIMIGIFIADFCCGLSFGWWKSSHNVHHLVTNSPEHDPDIQNTPLFATCPSQLKSVWSTYYKFTFVWDSACEYLIPYQKYVYYPIMALARFNLYALGWCHLISPRSKQSGAARWVRPAEIIAMSAYWFLFGYCLVLRTLPNWPTRVAFVLVSHMSSLLLHVQITLSHWGMPTCSLGDDECFAQKQLRTTMDVLCPDWLDWFHGGLQFQAIHHLFPRIPRHNLRSLQPLVKDFCAENGIHYNIHGFKKGNCQVVSRLSEISNQLSILAECQAHMAKTGESGLH